MKDIIFRGKRTDNGEWVYGVPTKDSHGETVMVESTFECDEYNCRGANCLYVDENTVGQYTGLTDKNGTKIFEGDIVNFKTTAYHFKNCRIKYQTYYVRYCAIDNKGYEYPMDKNFEYEVIGNIHDNPELLRSDTE